MEVKYAVPEDLAAWTLKWSGVFLHREYGLTGPQHVTSLYLDTPTLTFFRWHCDERADRFKLRIRGYGDGTRSQVWAEIKRKTGGMIHKERAPLSIQALDSVLRGAAGAPSLELEDFVRRRQAFHASPKLLLNCQRDALREKRASGEIGVTVDRFIRYQPTQRHDLVDNPQLWRTIVLPCPAGPAKAIVELKYMFEAPTWMASLMRRLAPYRVGFSKYRAAMQHHTQRAKY